MDKPKFQLLNPCCSIVSTRRRSVFDFLWVLCATFATFAVKSCDCLEIKKTLTAKARQGFERAGKTVFK